MSLAIPKPIRRPSKPMSSSTQITPETDPNTIKVVGGAVLYFLRAHEIDVNVKEVIDNTYRIQNVSKTQLVNMMQDKVLPGSIKLFDPNNGTYFDDLKNWGNTISGDMYRDLLDNTSRHKRLLQMKRSYYYTTINLIDSRLCNNGCDNTVYIEGSFTRGASAEITGVECEEFGFCKNVIGSVSGFGITRL